jgi:hypothetical protein
MKEDTEEKKKTELTKDNYYNAYIIALCVPHT